MRWIFGLVVLSIATCVVADEKPQAQEKVPTVTNERPMSFWMAQKIEHSKKILEALTKEDYASVEAEANHLRKLGKIEGFVRRKDQAYLRHQQTFDSSLIEIAAQAKEQNVEGAVLAFNQLTTSCIACHKTLRANLAESQPAKTDAK
jgi:cytochrome c556